MNYICLCINEILSEHLRWSGAAAIKMNQRLIAPKKTETQSFVCGNFQSGKGNEEMEGQRK